ncbi:hypothetical protein [Krasilnikovia sp. MM14-A1259]|uniref:DUF7691 family protein n=1 Tax=Krasilnikovia sp. MM14-A1259 TaxID=3373539 RepID=UPI0038252796
MGSNFMSIYVCDMDEVSRAVGCRDQAVARSLIETADEPLTSSMEHAIHALVERSYSRDPKTFQHETGPAVIRAFERVCAISSSASVTVEMYDDEEESPLLWNFIWDEWDGDDTLELPLSPHGVPAVTWHGPARTTRYLAAFEELRSSGSSDEEYLGEDEIDEIIEALQSAGAEGKGVFVFVEY